VIGLLLPQLGPLNESTSLSILQNVLERLSVPHFVRDIYSEFLSHSVFCRLAAFAIELPFVPPLKALLELAREKAPASGSVFLPETSLHNSLLIGKLEVNQKGSLMFMDKVCSSYVQNAGVC
jgi:hypothetical protein